MDALDQDQDQDGVTLITYKVDVEGPGEGEKWLDWVFGSKGDDCPEV